MSASFAHHAAHGRDWREATQRCVAGLSLPTGANLGFVYITDDMAGDAALVLAELRATTHIQHWVGAVAVGIFSATQDYYNCKALSVLVAHMPDEQFCMLPPGNAERVELSPHVRDWLAQYNPLLALVHGDPRHPQILERLSWLHHHTNAFLVGGLSSSRHENRQISDDKITQVDLTGVVFSDACAMHTTMSQGCVAISGMHTVTAGEGQWIHMLDYRPAVDVFKEDMEKLALKGGQLLKHGDDVMVGLPVTDTDTGDYMVRPLMGLDQDNGAIAVATHIEPGMRLFFTQRNYMAAESDLRRMLQKLKLRLNGAVPKAGIFISCVGRGLQMFSEPNFEIKTTRAIVGDFPITGFYASGEIFDHRLYGYTGILTVFL